MAYQQAYHEPRSFDMGSKMRPEMVLAMKLAKSDRSPSPMGGFDRPYTVQQPLNNSVAIQSETICYITMYQDTNWMVFSYGRTILPNDEKTRTFCQATILL